MRLMQSPVKVSILKELSPLSEDDLQRPRLDVITERGSIRVGYFANTLPYAFINRKNQVVGFDMEILHELASDLDISIEIYRFSAQGDEVTHFNDGSIDISIGGTAITPSRALKVAFTNSYSYHTAGLILIDSRKDDFSSVEKVNEIENLTLGIPSSSYYKKLSHKFFPNATLIEIDSPRQFVKGQYKNVDALIYSTETGSAWTILYPEYTATVPKGLKLRAPVGFALPKGKMEYLQFMNTWLKLKKENGFQQQVYDYWILGYNPKAIKPRWSVLKDVFGWDI